MRRCISFLTVSILLLSLSCSLSTGEIYHPPVKETSGMSDIQKDVYFLIAELPDRHKDLYPTISRSAYGESASGLLSSCASLDADHAYVALRELTASIGDAHTCYVRQMDQAFPFNLAVLDDGVFITAALDEADLEKELTHIAGIPVFAEGSGGGDLLSLMSRIVSHENPYQVRQQLSQLLLDPHILAGLDLLETDGRVRMTFDDTEIRYVSPTALSGFRDLDWKVYYTDQEDEDGGFSREALPDHLRYSKESYHHTYDTEERILHILYNSCTKDPEQTFSEFVDEAFEDRDPGTVVIDLRNNGGGNSLLIRPLYRRLDALADDVTIYTVIGPGTFSSALMNAIEIEERYGDRNRLIGRPTGGKPNHYGEVSHIELPSGAYLYWSTRYFTNDPGNDADALYPEEGFSIGLTSSDLFTEEDGTFSDPVTEYVKSHL